MLVLKNVLTSACFLFCLGAHAQVTTLYAQNFNSPATTGCPAWGGSGADSRLSTDYNGPGQVGSATFVQVGTADRFCWGSPGLNSDPEGTATPYSGGFARNGAVVESWAIMFDPQGKPFINGQIDLAHVTPGNLNGIDNPSVNYPGTASSVPMALRFFRIPVGTSFTLTAGTAAPVGSPANPANLAIAGVTQTPLPESSLVSITKDGSYSRYAANWNMHQFSVDTSSFAPGDRLAMVGTVINNLTYIVFDNLTITAASAAAEIPAITKQFGAPQVNAGQSTTLTINVAGNNITSINGLSVTDQLPAPLVVGNAGVIANTCGGTLAAPAGSDQIQLSNGVLPALGCELQIEVQWPATAVAQCSGSAVTNTIVDGTDFTVSGTTTAGTNATATLACPAPPAPPVASVNCLPKTLLDARGQSAVCTVTLNLSQPQDLVVNLLPPASNPRYQTDCLTSIIIPAGSTSATCGVTATANTVPGDGDASAMLSILDAPSSATPSYVVGIRSDSVLIQNDDLPIPLSAPTPVPTLSEYTLMGLSLILVMLGFRQSRKR